jgi:predicted nucleic acid-binding protein
MGKTVYWDANVFHALFNSEENRVESCLRIEQAAKNGDVDIYTSTITFVECVWIKGRADSAGKLNKLSPEHEKVIQAYFMHSFIRPINCDRQIAEAARMLLWRFPHLEPKDAIHVASAISQRVDLMHSYDNHDLVKLSGQIGYPPLKICNPGDGDGFGPQLKQMPLS